MKTMKKVTFKEFFRTMWCGVYQTLKWVLSMFGYKDETWYGKTVRRVFGGCLAAVVFMCTTIMAVEWARDMYDHYIYATGQYVDSEERHVDFISRYVCFDWDTHEVKHNLTGETIKNVDWVFKSVDGDSLAVFSKNGKRGYFNRFTCKVIMEPQFTRAWIFGSGVACVEKDGRLIFIDHSGKQVFTKTFEYQPNADGYVFHDGLCIVAMPDYNFGLLNLKGGWEIAPDCRDIRRRKNNYWVVKRNEQFGLYNDSIHKMVVPVEYKYADLTDRGILVQYDDNVVKELDYNLNVINDFVVNQVGHILYTMTNDSTAVCDNMYYSVRPNWMHTEERLGLMSKDGKLMTKPLYSKIVGITKDRYLCCIDPCNDENNVIIDSNGNIIK